MQAAAVRGAPRFAWRTSMVEKSRSACALLTLVASCSSDEDFASTQNNLTFPAPGESRTIGFEIDAANQPIARGTYIAEQYAAIGMHFNGAFAVGFLQAPAAAPSDGHLTSGLATSSPSSTPNHDAISRISHRIGTCTPATSAGVHRQLRRECSLVRRPRFAAGDIRGQVRILVQEARRPRPEQHRHHHQVSDTERTIEPLGIAEARRKRPEPIA